MLQHNLRQIAAGGELNRLCLESTAIPYDAGSKTESNRVKVRLSKEGFYFAIVYDVIKNLEVSLSVHVQLITSGHRSQRSGDSQT